MKVYVVFRATYRNEEHNIDSIYLNKSSAENKVEELKQEYSVVYIEEHKFYE